MMINISFKHFPIQSDQNTHKVILCDAIRFSIGVYNYILLKSSIKKFYIPNEASVRENKNKIRTFWGWKPSKIKNIEPREILLVLIKSRMRTDKKEKVSKLLNLHTHLNVLMYLVFIKIGIKSCQMLLTERKEIENYFTLVIT